jgi:hypothetical protein
MVEEARLEEVGSGLAPVSDGWFVVNVGRRRGCVTRPSEAAAFSRAARACLATGPI